MAARRSPKVVGVVWNGTKLEGLDRRTDGEREKEKGKRERKGDLKRRKEREGKVLVISQS